MKIRISLIKKLSICFFATVYTIVTIGCSSKGIKAFQKGDYDTALEVLEGTTSNGSADFVDEFWFLGLTYEALGDYENAEKYKDKAFNICQKSKSDAKDFSKKYPDAYKQLLEYGKTSGYDRTSPSSYHHKDLRWFETYGKQMGFSETGISLVKIPMKIHYLNGGTCEVYDNSNHYDWINLHWTDYNIGDQLKDLYYENRAFIAYCEIKSGMLYVNFIDFE